MGNGAVFSTTPLTEQTDVSPAAVIAAVKEIVRQSSPQGVSLVEVSNASVILRGPFEFNGQKVGTAEYTISAVRETGKTKVTLSGRYELKKGVDPGTGSFSVQGIAERISAPLMDAILQTARGLGLE